MSNATPEQLVAEAVKPGKLNVISLIKDRALPTDTVTILLDEQTAYLAAGVKEKIDAITDEVSKERELLQLQLDALKEKLKESILEFTIVGITEGAREAMLARSMDKFPMETKRDLNPLSGEFVEREIPSPERDSHFTNALWQSHITKIVAANGNEQTVITNNDASTMRSDLPIAAVGNITESIEKLRLASAMFMIEMNEDFLAKS